MSAISLFLFRRTTAFGAYVHSFVSPSAESDTFKNVFQPLVRSQKTGQRTQVSFCLIHTPLVTPTTPAFGLVENLQTLKRFAPFVQRRFPLSRDYEACIRHEYSYAQIQAKSRQQRLSGAHARRRPDVRLHEHFGNVIEYVRSANEGNTGSQCRVCSWPKNYF